MTVRLASDFETKATSRICPCTGTNCTSEGARLPPTGIRCDVLCPRQSYEHRGWGGAGRRDKDSGLSLLFLPSERAHLGPPLRVPTPGKPFIRPCKAGVRCLTPWAMSWFCLHHSGPPEPWVLAPSSPVPNAGFSVAPSGPGHESVSMATLEPF